MSPGDADFDEQPLTQDDLITELYYLAHDFWNDHELSVQEVVEALLSVVEMMRERVCPDCGIDTIKTWSQHQHVRGELWEAVEARTGAPSALAACRVGLVESSVTTTSSGPRRKSSMREGQGLLRTMRWGHVDDHRAFAAGERGQEVA